MARRKHHRKHSSRRGFGSFSSIMSHGKQAFGKAMPVLLGVAGGFVVHAGLRYFLNTWGNKAGTDGTPNIAADSFLRRIEPILAGVLGAGVMYVAFRKNAIRAQGMFAGAVATGLALQAHYEFGNSDISKDATTGVKWYASFADYGVVTATLPSSRDYSAIVSTQQDLHQRQLAALAADNSDERW
jgi:hypothetical protein